MKTIPFTHSNVSWELCVYETRDRHGDVLTRVAAYCNIDPTPRGPRRTWTLANGSLVLWGPNYAGDWSELDAAAREVLANAERDAALSKEVT